MECTWVRRQIRGCSCREEAKNDVRGPISPSSKSYLGLDPSIHMEELLALQLHLYTKEAYLFRISPAVSTRINSQSGQLQVIRPFKSIVH